LGAALWQIIDPPTADRARREQVCSAFNFGPKPEANRTVGHVVNEVLKHWPGGWTDKSDDSAPHEAGLLNLKIDKADSILSWRPVWEFEEAVAHAVSWYRDANNKADPLNLTHTQIRQYQEDAAAGGLHWATQ
jgi:CDP-glucose 4,6-dehydratase